MRYFMDVTPTVFDTLGAPVVLGAARYEITDDLIGEIFVNGPIRYYVHQPISLSVPTKGGAARVSFEVVLSPADAPQPMPITPNVGAS